MEQWRDNLLDSHAHTLSLRLANWKRTADSHLCDATVALQSTFSHELCVERTSKERTKRRVAEYK